MAPVETAYYELLEASPTAAADEITSAYRKMALKLHPDKGGDQEQFKAMKAAYDVLKDPHKRQMYDSHGAALVRAMDGEASPEVMLEVVMSMTKSASRMVLCLLPFVAVVLLFPAVALSLKWDRRIALNWTFVFIPLWIVHLIVLALLLKLRTVMCTSADIEAAEDESERADAEARKRNLWQVLTAAPCIVVLLMIQEAVMAAKLQGDTQVSWFVVLIPYLVFELAIIYIRIRLMAGTLSGPKIVVAMMLAAVCWWAVLRLITVGLIAAKADGLIACTWTLCLIPMMVGAGCKLLYSCRTQKPTGDESEEVPSSGPGFVAACFTIAIWLSMLLLGAGKLDGHEYSAFLVFLPFFLLVAQLLCCCTCLACCGPVVIGAFLREEQKQREQPTDEAQTLHANRAQEGYSTLP